ncbi:MAG: hypothetical protein ACQEQK_03830 [Thermodesulfobacteriota bacterium]
MNIRCMRAWGMIGMITCALLLSPHTAFSFNLNGFVDLRSGMRLQSDPYQRDAILNEARAQIDVSHYGPVALWKMRADAVLDEAAGEYEQDFERGYGILDLREANVLVTPLDFMDVKIGRQILTWGTGDLLFINDMFPKDWQSFFSGRDEEYLKAPSDAVFASMFFSWGSVDMAYMPAFEHDRYISGERISYYNPMLGRRAGDDDPLQVKQRRSWFADDEMSLRLSRNIGSYEVAAYAYVGYWKNPKGYDPTSAHQTFPRLRTYGASVRGNAGPGLFHAEVGYYDSFDDRDGDDPLIPNSEYRLLLGYEQELRRNLSAAFQYYLEYMQDYSAYGRALPATQPARDRDRHVLTLRLTQLAMNQNLTLSLFTYWSPSDADAYLRPLVEYKATDEIKVFVGGNIFTGRDEHTFFGQFENNTNVYAGVRYSY